VCRHLCPDLLFPEDMPHDDCVLHILCLHGFRQSGKQFKGRLQALQKRLRGVARLSFMDAPFELPHFISPAQEPLGSGHQQQCQPRRAWLVSQPLLELQRQQQHEQASRPHEVCMSIIPTDTQNAASQHGKESTPSAFLQAGPVGKAPQATPGASPQENAAMQAPAWIDSAQLHQQTIGWDQALAAVQLHMAAHGPYDGLLGFSQGAAVAAAVASVLAQQRCRSRPVSTTTCRDAVPGDEVPQSLPGAAAAARPPGGAGATPCDAGGNATLNPVSADQPDPLGCQVRFVVLCSGYIPGCPEVQQVLHPQQPLDIPSCHVYSVSGADQQVPTALSQQLAGCFAAERRVVVEHGGGHLIPSSQQVVQQIKGFLEHV
jgi:predicted esterase